jgi:hypothetical protein
LLPRDQPADAAVPAVPVSLRDQPADAVDPARPQDLPQ